MAKKSPAGTGKALMIVESPAKARTISKFLGKRFVIEASIGHVRDLPEGKKQIPAKYKDQEWAYLGVNVNEGFEPVYIVPPGKNEQVKKLKGLMKDATELWLATDEDREGEAISWHLQELLQPKIPVHRLVFHEITREAIEEAMEHPRQIDNSLVQAQETRRILDRLYGYDVSPLLWRKLGRRLSAGRVQSVAVRLIVDRERERMKFVSSTYFDVLGMFAKHSGEQLSATLVSADGKRIPAAKDFDSATGKLKDGKFLHLNGAGAEELVHKLRSAQFRVAKIEQTPYTQRPAPPFTTSTLQQEANRKLGFTARRTMQVAQALYENGHITYMRTDSTNLASVAVSAARELVNAQYGQQYLPAQPRLYSTKVKNAQEAHEAIRPAGHPFELPESLRGSLSHDEFRLFEMIWKRTVASQMADARGQRISITIEGGGASFQVGGKTIDFPGFLRAYVEGADDPQAELADRETILPSVTEGEQLNCQGLEPKSHTTQPPARYNEATLTRALEDLGIGRPSTYAAIIETIQARDYVFKKSNALVPTWVGFAVAQLLERHLPTLVDYQFTAQMEEDLDAISRGEAAHLDYLKSFYFGNGRPGLRQQLATKIEEIDPREASRISLGRPDRPGAEGDEIFVRIGRYGPFLEQGERRSPIPDGTPPDELTQEKALELLAQAGVALEPLGHCPDTGKPIYLKNGRFGPYVQRGDADDEDKPKNASLLKGMKPEDVDLATAIRLLSLPRTLGVHPESNEPIISQNGRFGPYIKCGTDTRSLPAGVSPIEVTLSEALELLAQPKAARRGFGAPKEPLRTLEASPITGEPIKLLEGRYGFYVTDGVTNASLPKENKPEELTLPQALDLLAIRAAAGPPAKKRGFRKGAPKAAGPKKAPKRAAKKKAPARKKSPSGA
ncbi:MAG: type I DNA topoisomerase [Planctomycetia bacterium]|nr:type I DNA topoisomerase [Planctomycetia bacterium]